MDFRAPVFAPASSNVVDDVDLDEVFADSFLTGDDFTLKMDEVVPKKNTRLGIPSLKRGHVPAPIPCHGAPPRSRGKREVSPAPPPAPPPPLPPPSQTSGSFGRLPHLIASIPERGVSHSVAAKLEGVAMLGQGVKRPAPHETEMQQMERRERNREHAKRSRVRKKFLLESLQAQMESLQAENRKLRQVIRECVPTIEAHGFFNGCLDASPEMEPAVAQEALVSHDLTLIQSLISSQQNFAVSDPSLPGTFFPVPVPNLDQLLNRIWPLCLHQTTPSCS